MKIKCIAAPGDGDRRLHRSARLAHGLRRAAARVSMTTASCATPGKVGTGFDDKLLRELTPQLAQARAGHAAVRESAARLRGEGRALGQARARRGDRVHRVEPRRCAAPSVVPGLALDKKASDVVRESRNPCRGQCSGQDRARRREQARRSEDRGNDRDRRRRRSRTRTSPISPRPAITKRELAEYYASDGAVDAAAHRRSVR